MGCINAHVTIRVAAVMLSTWCGLQDVGQKQVAAVLGIQAARANTAPRPFLKLMPQHIAVQVTPLTELSVQLEPQPSQHDRVIALSTHFPVLGAACAYVLVAAALRLRG